MTGKRKSCIDCGRTDFLHVIRAWCPICEPTLRCRDCHSKHQAHVGVVYVAKGPSGTPAFMRENDPVVARLRLKAAS